MDHDLQQTTDDSFAPVDAGAVPSPSTTAYPVEGAPSDNTTLVGVLQAFEQQGFTEQFIAGEDGSVTCVSCNGAVSASMLIVEASRRLEGASDPADMMTVVAARCPQCDAAGTLVLGYGPNASPEDVAVYQALGEALTRDSGRAHGSSGTVESEPLDPDAPGASLFTDGDAVEPNEPA
jgi:hypothetical protein